MFVPVAFADNASYKLTLNEVSGECFELDSNGGLIPSKVIPCSVDHVFLEAVGNELQFAMLIDGFAINKTFSLHASAIQGNKREVLIGSDDMEEEQGEHAVRTRRVVLEEKSNGFLLSERNDDLLGHSVASFVFSDDIASVAYVLQFNIDGFPISRVFDSVGNISTPDFDSSDIVDLELSYITLMNSEDIRDAFQAVDGLSGEHSLDDVSPLMDHVFDADEERAVIDELSTAPVDYQYKAASLIPDIPDYLYQKQENGTWTMHNSGYDDRGSGNGYAIYHMNDPISRNVQNYVLRFYMTTFRQDGAPDGQLETSFCLSHNLWVQYVGSTGRVFIFDDRSSNARLLVSPSLYYEVQDNPQYAAGYILSCEMYGVKNASPIKKFARLLVEYVPKLNDVQRIYETYTSPDSSGTVGKRIYEKGLTKRVQIEMDNLKYAPNGVSDKQDYISLKVYTRGVLDYFNYGFKYTIRVWR